MLEEVYLVVVGGKAILLFIIFLFVIYVIYVMINWVAQIFYRCFSSYLRV